MPVIINEFEVIVEPPQSSTPEAMPAPEAAELTPEDIERIFEYFRERRARVMAD